MNVMSHKPKQNNVVSLQMKESRTFTKILLDDKEQDQMFYTVSMNTLGKLTAEAAEKPFSGKIEDLVMLMPI